MLHGKRIACVIPARLKSTRFPEKVLASIHGKPLLAWIWQAATAVPFFDHVVFAVDAPQTATLVSSFGGSYIMTSAEHQSGTDRLAEVVRSNKLSADIWVNWQGDEPLISTRMVQDLLQTINDTTTEIWTLKQRITNLDEINSPQYAKVVCNEQGHALYFSRSPIPFYRDQDQERVYFKHIGMYAFTTKALLTIAEKQLTHLEHAEKLEQLRWLENDMRVTLHETNEIALGIDFPHDIAKAELLLSRNVT